MPTVSVMSWAYDMGCRCRVIRQEAVVLVDSWMLSDKVGLGRALSFLRIASGKADPPRPLRLLGGAAAVLFFCTPPSDLAPQGRRT